MPIMLAGINLNLYGYIFHGIAEHITENHRSGLCVSALNTDV